MTTHFYFENLYLLVIDSNRVSFDKMMSESTDIHSRYTIPQLVEAGGNFYGYARTKEWENVDWFYYIRNCLINLKYYLFRKICR